MCRPAGGDVVDAGIRLDSNRTGSVRAGTANHLSLDWLSAPGERRVGVGMRYWKGSVALSATYDYPLLRQVMRSTFITHRQLYDLLELDFCTQSRNAFNNRVLRLVRNQY